MSREDTRICGDSRSFFFSFALTNVERDVQFLLRSRGSESTATGELHSNQNLEREKRRNEREREQDTYTKGTTPGGTRRLGFTLPADMRMLREEPVGLFLHVSGKGWRQKVPELYQKPSRKDESEAGEEEAAEE